MFFFSVLRCFQCNFFLSIFNLGINGTFGLLFFTTPPETGLRKKSTSGPLRAKPQLRSTAIFRLHTPKIGIETTSVHIFSRKNCKRRTGKVPVKFSDFSSHETSNESYLHFLHDRKPRKCRLFFQNFGVLKFLKFSETRKFYEYTDFSFSEKFTIADTYISKTFHRDNI